LAKNLPATLETPVQSLDGEDPLEKGMAIHSSIIVQIISWTEEPGEFNGQGRLVGNSPWGHKVRHN